MVNLEETAQDTLSALDGVDGDTDDVEVTEDVEDVEATLDPEDQSDEEGSEEESEAPTSISSDEFNEYRAAAQKEINDLRAALGRFQSSVDRFEQGRGTVAEAAQVEAVQSELNQVYDVLAAFAEGVDETAIDEGTRARITQALGQAAQARARTELKQEVLSDLGLDPTVLDALRNAPQQQQQVNERNQLEAELVSEIRSYGLADTDERINWTKAASLSSADEIRASIRADIRAALTEDSANERRATRQKQAASGKSAPRAGKGRSDADLQAAAAAGEDVPWDELIESMKRTGDLA